MAETRRVAPEISPTIDPIPIQRRPEESYRDAGRETYRPTPSMVAPQTDWLGAGWKFGLGFMAAATLFGALDGLVLYILSNQGFHLSFGLPH